MAVMLFDHPRIGMTEILRDHHRRHTGHNRQTMPKNVLGREIDIDGLILARLTASAIGRS